MPYHEIPLEYLKFNFYNNRISTQAKEYRQIKAKELSQIPFEEANEITSVAEQTALTLQGDVQYKLKGTSKTTKDPDDPNVVRSENGVPKVVDATLDEKITPKITITKTVRPTILFFFIKLFMTKNFWLR